MRSHSSPRVASDLKLKPLLENESFYQFYTAFSTIIHTSQASNSSKILKNSIHTQTTLRKSKLSICTRDVIDIQPETSHLDQHELHQQKVKSVPISNNPFGDSDDDEDEKIPFAIDLKLKKIKPYRSPVGDSDSGCNVDMNNGSNKPYVAQVQNFNPFGSDSEDEKESAKAVPRPVFSFAKPEPDPDHCYMNLPTRPPPVSKLEPRRNSFDRLSFIQEPVYGTVKRKAPKPPEMSEKERLVLDLIELDSQLISLEQVANKIKSQIDNELADPLEFYREDSNLKNNRREILSKKVEACDK
ncbi:hypothetical protein Ciccas_000900 [Cichlidogyrus casuarinus]|uniref:Uncharacterized protein n=1 Tax=Cichlidogyrus casuarinus TaxID=1844966 RepID=A0ABD2QLM5_9PLAT